MEQKNIQVEVQGKNVLPTPIKSLRELIAEVTQAEADATEAKALAEVNTEIVADKDYDTAKFSGMGRVNLQKNIVDGHNYLTQEMISKPNTIYKIQYDYEISPTTTGYTAELNQGVIEVESHTFNYKVIAVNAGDIITKESGMGNTTAILYQTSDNVWHNPHTPVLTVEDGWTIAIADVVGGSTAVSYNVTTKSITIPENCVLEFEGGSISGGTLVGNGTGIEAGVVKIFSTDVNVGGSWNIVEAYPEWFGAKGDGVTDDIIPINKTLSLLILRESLKVIDPSIVTAMDWRPSTLVLHGKSYLLSDKITISTNISINGNGAILIANHNQSSIIDIAYSDYRGVISNLVLDGTGHQIKGLIVRGITPIIKNIKIYQCFNTGIVAISGYEHTYQDISIRLNDQSSDKSLYPDDYSNLIGFLGDTTDCLLSNIVVVNYPIGVKINKGPWNVTNVHIWGNNANGVPPCIGIWAVGGWSSYNNIICDTIVKQDSSEDYLDLVKGIPNGGIGVYSQGSYTSWYNVFHLINLNVLSEDQQAAINIPMYLSARNFVVHSYYSTDYLAHSEKIYVSSVSTCRLIDTDPVDSPNSLDILAAIRYKETNNGNLTAIHAYDNNSTDFSEIQLIFKNHIIRIEDKVGWTSLIAGSAVLRFRDKYIELSGTPLKLCNITNYADISSYGENLMFFDNTNKVPAFTTGTGTDRRYLYPFTYDIRDGIAGNNRPSPTRVYTGQVFFDTTLGKPTTWDGSKWIESDGATAGVQRAGVITKRPALADINAGFMYLVTQPWEDATLGTDGPAGPYYFDGSNSWILADGTTKQDGQMPTRN